MHCKSRAASRISVRFAGNWRPHYSLSGWCATSAYGKVSSGREKLSISLHCSHTFYWQYYWFVESHCRVPLKELNFISYPIFRNWKNLRWVQWQMTAPRSILFMGMSFDISRCGSMLLLKFSSHMDWVLAHWLHWAATINSRTTFTSMSFLDLYSSTSSQMFCANHCTLSPHLEMH